MYSLNKNDQSGRSMVEMLGVLAIIGVLSIGGISGYSKAMSKFRINKTLDQISMLVMNIRSLFASSVDYDGLTNASAIQMGIIPRDMMDFSTSGETTTVTDTIVNAYQGRVFIGNPNDNKRQFYVAYTGLNQESCIALLTADWGAQSGSGLVSITSEAQTDKTEEPTPVEEPDGETSFSMDNGDFPIPIAKAATACAAASDAGGTALVWSYY